MKFFELCPSKFGKDDQLGALNYIARESTAAAVRLVRNGRIFSLMHMLEDEIPVNWFHKDFIYHTYRSAPEMLKYFDSVFPNKNRISFTNIRMEMSDHTGTHIDGLNHATIGYSLYNDVDVRDVTTTRGTSRLGIENMLPIVTRGVLIDMTLLHVYDGPQAIPVSDIERVISIENIQIRRGDAVLIYTGWERFWKTDNQRYVSSMPGIGVEAASWLASQEVATVGSDTQSVEVEPNEEPGVDGRVHQILITENGIPLIENMKLSELASAKVYEFLFVCTPLKIRGATGSPVHPIAIS
jgi:kynurenine formamidase